MGVEEPYLRSSAAFCGSSFWYSGKQRARSRMQMTFRWFGPSDPIPLAFIRQIPGVRGVVSALYEVPPGQAWSRDRIAALAERVDDAGMRLTVIESIPVHEDIKLGRPSRDRLIDNYCESVRHVGELGIHVLCYNFMPIFDWMRTELAHALPDGSTCLAYDDAALAMIDLSRGTGDLPGWGATYDAVALGALREAYRNVGEEQLWEHLAYFLERVVPEAERVGVRMAIHPDDPPWSIFGLPRIITNAVALERLVRLVDRPANGVTFCTGSLGVAEDNDLPRMARRLCELGRLHFAHCRNVKRTGAHRFHETPHPSTYGDVDMFAVLRVLAEAGFTGPMRPDHGRMIWGEEGRPGYGLFDRALGAVYLQGLWEGVERRLRQ